MGGGAGPAVLLMRLLMRSLLMTPRLPLIWSRKLPSLMAVLVTQTAPAMLPLLSPLTKQLLWSLVLPTF